jgi:outer membrane protein assembly factor BamB
MKFSRFVVISLAIIVILGFAMSGNTVADSSASPFSPPGHVLTFPSVSDPLKPSVNFLQAGLSGEIGTDIAVMELSGEEEAVLLGTSSGLYIVSQGTLLNYIQTPSLVQDIALLDDLTGDYQQDIVIAIQDIYFPNIRCYDSDTGAKLWQFIPKQEVFIDNLMWTEQQMPTFDLEVLDVNGDEIKDVIATSGYRIYAIDGRTGEELWVYQASNNLWKIAATADINIDGFPDIAVGGQNGFVHVLSGKDGELIWRERVAERYDVMNDQNEFWATVDRSVWDILPLGTRGNSQTVVGSEDGKVRLINLTDGTVEWEIDVIEYVASLQFQYYRQKSQKPTSPGETNFFNIRLTLVDDISGDGVEEVLASTHMGTGRSGLFMINGASGIIEWQMPGLDMDNVYRVEITSLGGEQVILMPKGKSGFTDEVDVINLENGTKLKTIKIKSGPESASGSLYRVRANGDETFIIASDYGDLLMVSPEGDVLWDYPRVTDVTVERGEFHGDSAEDFLIQSQTYLHGKGDVHQRPTTRVLYLIDGDTMEKVWTYEVPHEEFMTTGGISSVRVTPDINGDGKQDIAGFIQIPEEARRDKERGENSRIIALSGKDGTILLKEPVLTGTSYGNRINKWIMSFDVITFRKGGPAPVGFLVRVPNDIFLLNPEGEVLSIWTYEPHQWEGLSGVKTGPAGGQWNRQLVIDDLNGDGGDDLAVITNSEIYIVETDIGAQTGTLDFDTSLTIKVEGGMAGQQAWLGEDVDGDDIRDIYYFRHEEARPPILTYVSPVTGDTVLEVEYDPNGTTLDPGAADFDNDGYNDSLLLRRWLEGKEGPKLELLSGRNKAVIWEYNDYRDESLFRSADYFGSIMPACPVSDISGDGVTDLALVRNLTWQPGAQILVYDVMQDREIKCIVLEGIDSAIHRDMRWHPGFLVREISDVNGDGAGDLAAIVAFGETAQQKEWQLIVIDIHHEQTIADFRIIGVDFVETDTGDAFMMIGLRGEVYVLNIARNLQITAPADGSIQTSPVKVEWTGIDQGAFNQVLIDGIEVGRTNENELSVPVAHGEHELEVRSLDEYGRGIYQNVTISVEKSPTSVIMLIIWLALFLIITLVPPVWGLIVRRQRRREHHG